MPERPGIKHSFTLKTLHLFIYLLKFNILIIKNIAGFALSTIYNGEYIFTAFG